MNTTTAKYINRSEINAGIEIGNSMIGVCFFEIDTYMQYTITRDRAQELLKIIALKVNPDIGEVTGVRN